MNLYKNLKEGFVDSKPFLVSPNSEVIYSYADIDHLSGLVATHLAERGLVSGDRIFVQVEKSVNVVVLYLACLRSGIVYIPLNTQYLKHELEFFTADARPKIVITDKERKNTFERFTKTSDILILDELISISEKLKIPELNYELDEFSGDAAAAMLYTSGTTGKPKGAILSHKNLIANAQSLTHAWNWSKDDVLIHALPIFHVHGLFVGLNLPLANGSSIIYLDKFSSQQVINILPKATVFMGVPTYYVRMLSERALTKDSCKSIRVFISGSAPLLEQTFRDFKKKTGHEIVERYGMTETGMNASNPLQGLRKPGSVGLPLEGVQIRARTDSGHISKAGEPGEIEVKGQNVFAGYWNREEYRSRDFTEDGFFRTGDLGRIDSEGYLFLIGRKKDLIISGGLNVFPKELELVIDSFTEVKESAVIGLPHPDFGEQVVAVIVAEETSRLDKPMLINKMRNKIASFKIPKEVYFFDELPRNTMGKVQKNILRKKLS